MENGVRGVARALVAEASRTDERRLLVLAGAREACDGAADDALDAAALDAVLVSDRDVPDLDCERVPLARTERLLGTTHESVVLDCHDATRPNALGRVVGTVDGGGLLVLLAPALDSWPDHRDGFDEGLTAPPARAADVTGRFRRRLVDTLRAHRGVAIVDADDGTVERDGLTDPAPRRQRDTPQLPANTAFPAAAYEACLTGDQMAAVAAFEALSDGPAAVVVEADRGRGKSSAAGLAAASLAHGGRDVLVTAPGYRNAAEVFARAAALLADLGALDARDGDPPRRLEVGDGVVRFADPAAAADLPDDPDVVVVDEAAALPVGLLESYLDADRVAYATTVHGYEGSGRGFDVRFRDRLTDYRHAVTEVHMADPVRYARSDPVEAWAFHALALDASPAVDVLVEDATPETVAYEAVDRDALAADENRLREVFGLLVAAHYRTEPDDLARMLDAPNVSVRALTHGGHVVAVALLAREGGLDAATRHEMYEGSRVRGHMLPDVLTSQLRDEDAAVPEGLRVVRIATHHAARSRGLGSRLLDEIREEFTGADWLGAGFGATPELVDFWADNGFSTVQVSTTRNERSGEHSAIVLAGLSERGRALRDRHADWFAGRVGAVLGDALAGLDPDVARAAMRACDAAVGVDLSARDWRLLAGASYGPALYSVDPRPFRALARKHLVDPADPDALTAREERLLVAKVLQGRSWDEVAADLNYHSTGQCMRALGDAYRPLVDTYGDDVALAERRRYED
jgi:tRNA(Met) cytidine acetyltransferase